MSSYTICFRLGTKYPAVLIKLPELPELQRARREKCRVALQPRVVSDVPPHGRFQELRNHRDNPLQILTRRQGPPGSWAYESQMHREGTQMKQSSLGSHVDKRNSTSFLETLTSGENPENPMCVSRDDEPWTIFTDTSIPDLPESSALSTIDRNRQEPCSRAIPCHEGYSVLYLSTNLMWCDQKTKTNQFFRQTSRLAWLPTDCPRANSCRSFADSAHGGIRNRHNACCENIILP